MTITQSIAELLKRDNSVVIPLFGTLKSIPNPAKISVITNHFAPPSSKIEFIADNTIQDEILANYISENGDISIQEAKQQITDFINNCKSEFNNYNKIHFEGLGKLARKYDGTFEFELDDNINLNDDAFGLPDFHQNPILRVEPSLSKDDDTDKHNNDIDTINDNNRNADSDTDEHTPISTTAATVVDKVDKTEPLQSDTDEKNINENKNNNTESTESKSESESNIEPEKQEKKRRIWPWILLLLLILCAGFAALTYFELIPNYIPQIIKPKNDTPYVIGGEPRPYYHFEYTEPEDTTTYLLPYPEAMTRYNDSIQRIADSIAMEAENIAIDATTQVETTLTTDTTPSIDNSTVETPEPKKEPVVTEPVVEPTNPEPKHFIVCGCFSMEENAQKKANALHESGFPNAFYKKRGSMWNVYYDGYVDKQEAKSALDEIRSTVNPKAWLLSK